MRPAPNPHPAALDRAAVRAEMDQARTDFHRLASDATPADLRRPSDGTRWTNQQLLFHMLFGYLLVPALLVLARVFARLPGGAGKAFAGLLDSLRGPFHLINYLGSCAGARIVPRSRMAGMLDKVSARLACRLDAEPDSALRRGMHYPTTWDPFFTSYMTLADLYRYPTRHFRYHQHQLTLGRAIPASTTDPRQQPRVGTRARAAGRKSRPGAGLAALDVRATTSPNR
jgi:hypothetical protein